MPDPLVVLVMRKFKADLFSMEKEQVQVMTRRWLSMEKTLEGSFESLAQKIADLRANGEDVPRWKLVKLARYQALLAQVKAEIGQYNTFAAQEIAATQLDLAGMGIGNAVDAIKATYAGFGQVAGAFDVLPVRAVEFMIGNAGDGSPLGKLLKASYEDSVDGITNELVRAITLGINPRETARAMANGFGVGLDRALNIARTEQLRVYRESSRMAYQNSGVVSGYKRLSARDTRVCAGCLFGDDGRLYDLDTPFEEHPQGRCTPVPVVSGLPAVTWQDGSSWFVTQPETVQMSILGRGRYEAWKDGQFELANVVARRENETWGAALVPAPLKDLLHNH